MKKLTASLVLLMLSVPALAAKDSSIQVSLEEPANNAVYSGVSNLRGWSINSDGIERIELSIDGKYVSDIPYGGIREDVGGAYPSVPQSDYSGYSMAYNYSALSAGTHTTTVRAYNNRGDFNESTASFTVAPLSASFISDANKINLNGGGKIEIVDRHSVKLSGALIDGKPLDISLLWRPATQGFAIKSVNPSSATPSYLTAANGFWKSTALGDNHVFQIYIPNGPEPRTATSIFLDLNDRSFEAGEGTAANNKATLMIDDFQVTARYELSFTSSARADVLVSYCNPKPGYSCLRQSGDRISIYKAL